MDFTAYNEWTDRLLKSSTRLANLIITRNTFDSMVWPYPDDIVAPRHAADVDCSILQHLDVLIDEARCEMERCNVMLRRVRPSRAQAGYARRTVQNAVNVVRRESAASQP
jgi:hypothetical protein